MSFKVQRKSCTTCIYRKGSPFNIAELERQVADRFGGFKGHRICHHSKDVCCAGFWARHKDRFPAGQIAQRLDCVELVDVDVLKEKGSNRVRDKRAGSTRGKEP